MNTNDEDARDDSDDVDNEEIVDALQDEETPENPAEVDEETVQLTSWDNPADNAGHIIPKVPLDDEISPVEQMVNEGLDLADTEIRVAAADPDL